MEKYSKNIKNIIALLRKFRTDHKVNYVFKEFVLTDEANFSRDKCFSLKINLNIRKNETVAFKKLSEIKTCFENIERSEELFLTVSDYSHYHPRFQNLPERTDTGHGELTKNVKFSVYNSWALKKDVIEKHAVLSAALAAL